MTSPLTAAPVVHAVGQVITAALTGDLEQVALLDGIDPQQAYATQSITLGGTWDPDLQTYSTSDVVLVETAEVGAGRRLVETTSIAGIVYSGGDGLDIDGHRVRVNQMLTAIRNSLRRLHDVDGSSAVARMPSQQWAQVVDDQGTGLIALITITVQVLP